MGCLAEALFFIAQRIPSESPVQQKALRAGCAQSEQASQRVRGQRDEAACSFCSYIGNVSLQALTLSLLNGWKHVPSG